MQGKYVLITGGTGGIGKQTAIGLAKMGAHIVINGRDQMRGEQAVKDIQAASGNPHIGLLLADLSRQSEIHKLAQSYQSRYPRLDVLLNNAGHYPRSRQLTEDGIEAAFAVNVIAPHLLTHLLLPLLQTSRPARVINLAGGLPFGKIDLTNLQSEKSFNGFGTYSHTKKAMLTLSLAWAKRLEGTGVTITVAYPGRAETEMITSQSENAVPFVFRLLGPIFNRFVPHGEITVIRAAQCSIYLASSPEVEGMNGIYFNPQSKPWKWPPAARNEANQQAIWQIAERFTQSINTPAF